MVFCKFYFLTISYEFFRQFLEKSDVIIRQFFESLFWKNSDEIFRQFFGIIFGNFL